ncbi:hypothetical protein Dimus_015844 [Dionaea muscipula]
MAATSSPFFSPSSEKRFWTTTLQSRVDDIRENRKHLHSSSSTKPGARELGKPPTLTEILQSKNSEEETDTKKVVQSGEPEEGVEEEKKGVKRKVGLHDSLSDEDGCLSAKEDGDNQVKGKLKKAKV